MLDCFTGHGNRTTQAAVTQDRLVVCLPEEGNWPQGWVTNDFKCSQCQVCRLQTRQPPGQREPLLPVIARFWGLYTGVLLVTVHPRGHTPFRNLKGNEGLNFRVWPLILHAPEL